MPEDRAALRPDDPTSEAPVEVVLYGEELSVDTEWVPWRRVRVVKRVVTESRTVTVEVRREELVIEELPVDDPSAVRPGGRPGHRTGQHVELVLHHEEVTVNRQVVPTEKVTLTIATVPGAVELSIPLASEDVCLEPTDSA